MPSKKYIQSELMEVSIPQGITNVTPSVDPNEKAFMLVERNNMPRGGGPTPRRFQVIYVKRNGELAAFVRDLGEISEDLGEFVFPLLWEYSVAEAADVANMWREENGLKEKLDERAEKSTLMEDFHTLQEVKTAVINNRTTFGSGSTAPTSQRIGFHPKG